MSENPGESSKSPVQSALESDADSNSDESAGPGSGSSSSGESYQSLLL